MHVKESVWTFSADKIRDIWRSRSAIWSLPRRLQEIANRKKLRAHRLSKVKMARTQAALIKSNRMQKKYVIRTDRIARGAIQKGFRVHFACFVEKHAYE